MRFKIGIVVLLSLFFVLLIFFCAKNDNTTRQEDNTESDFYFFEDEMELTMPEIPDGYRLDRPELDLDIYMPLETGKVSSLFGMRVNPVTGKYKFHSGYDIAAPEGVKIFSAMDGFVKKTGFDSGYGNFVIISHESGVETLYAHISEILCKEKEKTSKGEVIAKVGSTGTATGSHLHFELHINGEKYDPEWVLGGRYC